MDECTQEIDYREYLADLMHDLRHVGHVIKAASEEASIILNDKRKSKHDITEQIEKIFDNAYILALMLDITEYELDPRFFETQTLAARNMYGKFYKVKPVFERFDLSKKIKINLEGSLRTSGLMYPIIDILPYILLQNYVKYSISNSVITIEFDENEDNIFIDISGMCVAINDNELKDIFEKGFRSKNVCDAKIEGTGRGLFLAKDIIEMHDGSIKMLTNGGIQKVNDIPYQDIITKIIFPKDNFDDLY